MKSGLIATGIVLALLFASIFVIIYAPKTSNTLEPATAQGLVIAAEYHYKLGGIHHTVLYFSDCTRIKLQDEVIVSHGVVYRITIDGDGVTQEFYLVPPPWMKEKVNNWR